VARRGRGAATTRTDAAPGGLDDATNGSDEDQPGARTMGAIAVQRWVARSSGKRSESTDGDDPAPTQGPYDEDDLDPEQTAAELVDFGAVRVPVPRGGQVSVEPEEGRLQAVHVMLPTGRLSVSALAAPRTERLWPDLAAEIDESLREGGATVRSFSGEWGRELHARTGEASSVFVGVDGPRWMLYGVATGPTSAAAELDAALRRMLRGTVVVRGRLPYPVRTVLPLTVPERLAVAGPVPNQAGRVPAARASGGRPVRNGRLAGSRGRATGAGAQQPAPPEAAAPSDGGGNDVATAPHGLPRVASAAGVDERSPRTTPPRVNGAEPGPSARRGEARSAPASRAGDGAGATPQATGASAVRRPPAGERAATQTGQRRVAELLAEAERDRAARVARAAQAGGHDVQGVVSRPGAPSAGTRPPASPPPASPPPGSPSPASPLLGPPSPAVPPSAPWAASPAAPSTGRPHGHPSDGAPAGAAVPDPSERWGSELQAGPPVGDARGAGPDPVPSHDDRYGTGHDDVAPLRLGGAPHPWDALRAEPPVDRGWSVEASETVRAPASAVRPDPVEGRPSDGSDDWTVPMSVVPPGPVPETPGAPGEPDLWAGDPWADEARRAARAARAAERAARPGARERGPREGGAPDREAREREARERGAADNEARAREARARETRAREARERAAHERGAHERPAHRRAAHERPARDDPSTGRAAATAAVDVPAARVAPPVRAPLADTRPDPVDRPPAGRHRRPER
jgi:Protein of unknown function (DUF3710)